MHPQQALQELKLGLCGPMETCPKGYQPLQLLFCAPDHAVNLVLCQGELHCIEVFDIERGVVNTLLINVTVSQVSSPIILDII